ncbi:M18 family aminopeptidase [Salinibacterium sp. M195]|uniref:M18 family aminopeptidase n=1 Tax=Salinibacterium sp. M195 TaxID=2583374 RepID=UPI001C62AAAA|nr:M18 family aminopeptidase [Salinibacterium sp. M195]QYH36216.1 M18 family aminopeptidase [Salinibacterium sp. M195]
MTAALDHIHDLASFVTASPSSFHAVAEAARRLREAGFSELQESEDWNGARTRKAAKYFVIRDGAIAAWIQPTKATATTPFRILGAHTDSPSFKLKPQPTTGNEGMLQAGVEVYGGPLLNSWLDRELELAGRIIFSDGTTELVRTGPLLRFPQLAVHLDRKVNDGLTLKRQAHMNPVLGLGETADADLLEHLAALLSSESSKRKAADIDGYDIVLADTATPAVFGLEDKLFASGRLDNLSSVHAGLVALIGLTTRLDHVPVFVAFDHEEVGSATRSGAAGPFLADLLVRIGQGLGGTDTDRMRAVAGSWCLSSDAGHAAHPNYPERHDPANRPRLGGGPLLKINANQRYATDGVGAAEWARACRQAGVEYQEFVSHNDMPCGSTIGPITATRLGIRTIDVGLPLLSMHSAREMCGVADPLALTSAIAAFYSPA